jgi:hypothetical protein
MADPLSGVYKAGQSPSFASGRRPWGRMTAAGEFRAQARPERIVPIAWFLVIRLPEEICCIGAPPALFWQRWCCQQLDGGSRCEL